MLKYQIKKTYIMVSSALLFVACTQKRSTGTCTKARISDDIETPKAILREKFALPLEIAGGVLSIELKTGKNYSEKKEIQCTAFLTFDGARFDKFRVWTARHCFKGGIVQKMQFSLTSSKNIMTFPIISDTSLFAKNIAEAHPSRTIDFKNKLLSLAENEETDAQWLSNEALRECKSKQINFNTSCFTAADMAIFDATMADTITPEVLDSLKNLDSNYKKALKSMNSEPLFLQYEAGMVADLSVIKIEKVIIFLEKTKNCGGNLLHTSNTIRDFCSKQYISGQLENEIKTWQDLRKKSKSIAQTNLAAVWAAFDEPQASEKFPILYATNAVKFNSTRFGWFPSFAKLHQSQFDMQEIYEEIGERELSTRTFLFKSRPGEGNVEFASGDSGSMLFFGFIPVAAMSHKNGEETSGGAAVLPLPVAVRDNSKKQPHENLAGPPMAPTPPLQNLEPKTVVTSASETDIMDPQASVNLSANGVQCAQQ